MLQTNESRVGRPSPGGLTFTEYAEVGTRTNLDSQGCLIGPPRLLSGGRSERPSFSLKR